MKYFAVIDTNVVVSSLIKKESFPGKVIDFISKEIIVPLFNDDILNEYNEVLSRPKFGLQDIIIENTIKLIVSYGLKIEGTDIIEEFADKTDIVFFQVTMDARTQDMDAYLVTGNGRHFPNRPFVITPKEMVEIIESDQK